MLRENDILVIKSIDRLSRDYKMIIEEWRDITKNIKADIKMGFILFWDKRLCKIRKWATIRRWWNYKWYEFSEIVNMCQNKKFMKIEQ